MVKEAFIGLIVIIGLCNANTFFKLETTTTSEEPLPSESSKMIKMQEKTVVKLIRERMLIKAILDNTENVDQEKERMLIKAILDNTENGDPEIERLSK